MKNGRKIIAKILIVIMICSFVFPYVNGSSSFGAKAKPKLSAKKITVTVKKTKKIFVKNVKKAKITWKAKNKKIATVKAAGARKAKVKGVKKGTTKIICKVVIKKKKYNLPACLVKVKAEPKGKTVKTNAPIKTPVASAKANNTPSPKNSPTATLGATPTPTATVTSGVTPTPTATLGATPTPTATVISEVTPTPTATLGVTPIPSAAPTVGPTENPLQPMIPDGYQMVDLSKFTSSDDTKVNYDNSTGLLKVTGSLNALNFALDNTLNEGENVHFIVRGAHEGTSNFRCMLGNNTTGVSNNIPSTNGLTGDGVWPKQYGFVWQYTLTVATGKTANLFMFKGPDGSTNLDNLTIYSILIKYGGEGIPSLYKVQPVIETKPTVQAISYGSPLSSATLSGGVAKYGSTTVEGTFSWYSPTTIPAGGTNYYTVKFTPTGVFAELYNIAVCSVSVTPTGYTENSDTILYENFDSGNLGMFTGRTATAAVVSDGYVGQCLKGSGRTSSWNGLQVDITSLVTPGSTYTFSAYGKTATTIDMSIEKTVGGVSYDGVGSKPSNNQWVDLSGTYKVPDGCTKVVLYFQTDVAGATNDIFIDEVKITQKNVVTGEAITGSLKESYEPIFGYVGGAIPYSSIKSDKHMNFVKSQFNSISMENEMKPDAILGGTANLTSTATLPTGYIANETYAYRDTKYPTLNFSVVDDCIERAYNAGVKMRFHVLLWHAQTPKWFFTENYSSAGNYVTAEVMNGRLEYFIRNVMNHVYNTEHGKDVVYCWDVVNEYTHNNDGGKKSYWDEVYYPAYAYSSSQHSGIWNPCYVIDAFTIADNQLSKLETQGKIPDADKIDLFYNDYNEYIETDNIVTLLNNVNADKKVCDGVGMQMHLNVRYPNPSATGEIAKAIDKFNNAGLKVQLTEIDVTYYPEKEDNKNYTLEDQINYWDTLFKMIVAKKNAGANITGITFWGLDDASSWRKDGTPLLFDSLTTAKPMYFNVLAAANNYYGN